MKYSAIAFAVLAACAGTAAAQSNVTIYGVVDAGIARTDNGATTTTTLDSGLQSGSRLGFKGSEDLGGGLTAGFTLENGFSADTGNLGQSSRLFGRQAFLSLSGGSGALRLGRQYNPIRPVVESIDPFGLGLAGNAGNVFALYGERADNTINYATPNLNGFGAQFAYSFGEVPESSSIGRQIGASGTYANGPLTVALAYHRQNLVATGNVDNGMARTTMLGGTYDFGMVKAHLAYGVNKGETAAGVENIDTRDAMIGVSAPLGSGAILASYLRKDDKGVDARDSSMWALGYTHNLSKRTNLYTSYARIRNDTAARVGFGGSVTAGADPSTVNVGLRHKF